MRLRRFLSTICLSLLFILSSSLPAVVTSVKADDTDTTDSAAAAWSDPLHCVEPYAVSNPAAVSTQPSTAIGVMGHRAPASGQPSWNGDDRVDDLAYDQPQNLTVAGGEFDSYIWKGTTYTRHNLVVFNATTGQPSSVAFNVDGEILATAISCDGSAVFIGGTFHHVDGVARNYLARVSLTDGSVNSWNPNPNNYVQDLYIARDQLIVAGDFSSISGVGRSVLASVSLSTGQATGLLQLTINTPNPNGPLKVGKAVADPGQNRLAIVGNFKYVGHQAHNRIAIVNLAAPGGVAQVYPWATPDTQVRGCYPPDSAPLLDVAWSPNGQSFFTASTGRASNPGICDSIVRWSASDLTTTSAAPAAQQFTGGDSMSAVVATDYTVWATGHNRWANNPPLPVTPENEVTPCSTVSPVDMNTGYAGHNCKGPGALDRPGLIAMSLGNMQATAWNPTRSKQRGMHNAMILTPQGLWIGSDGDYAGNNTGSSTEANLPHNDLVLFPFQ